MLKNIIYIATLFIVAIESNAMCSQNPDWNWNKTSYLVINDNHTEASIPSPFVAGSAYGLDISNQEMCYEDGWRLYAKKLSCTDFGADCSIPSSTDGDYRPVMVMYNIYTGQMRFFIYTRDFERNDQELLVKTQINTGGIDTFSDTGLFLNEGTPITVLSEKESAYSKSDWMVFPSYKNKWVIFDKFLSYDPSSNFLNNTRLSLLISQRNTSEIQLKGDLSIETSGTLKSAMSDSSSKNIGLSDLYNIYKAYGEPGKWASDLESNGEKLVNTDSEIKQSAGQELLSMAAVVSDLSNPLGYANAAYSAISLFKGGKTQSSTSYISMYSSGQMSVSGAVVEESPIEFIQLGLQNSNQSQDIDKPKLAEQGYSHNIGLVSITERPKVIIQGILDPWDSNNFPGNGGNRYIEVDCPFGNQKKCTTWFKAYVYSFLNTDNIKDLVLVNPNSDMVLQDIAIQPMLDTSDYREYGPSMETSWYINEGMYNPSYVSFENFSELQSEILKCANEPRGFGYCLGDGAWAEGTQRWDDSGEVSPRSMLNLFTKELAVGDATQPRAYKGWDGGNLAGVITTGYVLHGSSHGFYVKNRVEDIFLNMYLMFRHKYDSSIEVEIKIRVPVEIGVCDMNWSESRLPFSRHEDSKFFTPTDDQCSFKKQTKTISNPVRWDQYSSSNRNPIRADSSSMNRYCKEEFDTSFKTYTSFCADDEIEYSYFYGSWKRGETNNRCTEFVDSLTCY